MDGRLRRLRALPTGPRRKPAGPCRNVPQSDYAVSTANRRTRQGDVGTGRRPKGSAGHPGLGLTVRMAHPIKKGPAVTGGGTTLFGKGSACGTTGPSKTRRSYGSGRRPGVGSLGPAKASSGVTADPISFDVDIREDAAGGSISVA